ncbi:response regulator [Desulfobacter hydrogenophilus]|uniref:response regulator n=1 Tax=Desulfobacter hydrogenophilus TaxID=2291 RepID=UPI0013D1C096|nr:response regulator [Desulfobacter hydrogenophilus]NDY71058.1 response regulator [Desulfobacter hydrogenophilus]
MSETHTYPVLIVDDEKPIATIIQRLLEPKNITTEYAADGEQALLKMRQAATPYSLIISDQKMPEMTGDALLEKAALISPDTARFMMSGYTDLSAIIRAINNGAINRFIPKPLDKETFIRAVLDAVAQFEADVEAKRLFEQAKTQNLKLFELYKELKQETQKFEQVMDGLDAEIAELTHRMDVLKLADLKDKKVLDRIEQSMEDKKLLTQDNFAGFAAQVREEVYIQFQDIAIRNGLTMPGKN